jgi:hypothetical protein
VATLASAKASRDARERRERALVGSDDGATCAARAAPQNGHARSADRT